MRVGCRITPPANPTYGVTGLHCSNTNTPHCGLWFIEARDHPLDRGSSEFTLLGNPYRPSTRPMPEFVDRRSPFGDPEA